MIYIDELEIEVTSYYSLKFDIEDDMYDEQWTLLIQTDRERDEDRWNSFVLPDAARGSLLVVVICEIGRNDAARFA